MIWWWRRIWSGNRIDYRSHWHQRMKDVFFLMNLLSSQSSIWVYQAVNGYKCFHFFCIRNLCLYHPSIHPSIQRQKRKEWRKINCNNQSLNQLTFSMHVCVCRFASFERCFMFFLFFRCCYFNIKLEILLIHFGRTTF